MRPDEPSCVSLDRLLRRVSEHSIALRETSGRLAVSAAGTWWSSPAATLMRRDVANCQGWLQDEARRYEQVEAALAEVAARLRPMDGWS